MFKQNLCHHRVFDPPSGLSPAWMLQYVLVKDLQTGSSFYFLVEEWLSVDNERTDGRVEIEAEASGEKLIITFKVRPMVDACLFTVLHDFLFPPEEAVLLQLPRLLRCELQRALCESHLWLSLLERPPRSPFTRLQRATCCAVLLQLFLLANTLWYSIVLDRRHRFGKVFFFCHARQPVCLSTLQLQAMFFFKFALQPAGSFECCFIKWRDGGGRHGDLSDRLPALPARLHAVQDEPQQGDTNLQNKCPYGQSFCYLELNISPVCVCVWTSVCVCGAGATTSRPGVSGD